MKSINKIILMFSMVFVLCFAFIVKPKAYTIVEPEEPESYEVTFVSNGGESVDSIKVYYEDGYKLPTPLPTTTKANYIFVGWFCDSGFESKAFAGDPILTDITLYAKWEEPEEPVDPELTGYRPLLDSDIGKKFGVDLYSKIYFNLDYEVGYELFNGVAPGTADRILIDWVVPESSYRLELWSFFFDVEWENRDLENFIFFSHGRNIGDNRIDIYHANFSDSPVSYGYLITDYTLPYKSYIYHIENDIVKNFILVKDLDEELSYEEGYIDGFAAGKRANGLTINGIFYSGQDLYDYAFNKGLSDTESNSGIAVLVSGFFSALAMFGNVEILPGLKIFYIVGFFLVIGLIIFMFKIRGK